MATYAITAARRVEVWQLPWTMGGIPNWGTVAGCFRDFSGSVSAVSHYVSAAPDCIYSIVERHWKSRGWGQILTPDVAHTHLSIVKS